MEPIKEKSVIKLRLTIALAVVVMAACNTWLSYHKQGIEIREVQLQNLGIRFGLSFVVVAIPILGIYAYATIVHYRKKRKDKWYSGDKY